FLFFFFFFFSSRRRHTRWPRDWSSDVCSSDLDLLSDAAGLHAHHVAQDQRGDLGGDQPVVGLPSDAGQLHRAVEFVAVPDLLPQDRKSTRLNSSHVAISYAVFCLKKKKHMPIA